MFKRFAARLALGLGLVLGVALTYVPRSFATRNSSGTYSLPAGNPVVSGTTISSATHNSTMSDVATALTDSLDRNGKGAMLAPLQCSNGTVAAPSLTFGSDTDTGLYRCAANEICVAAGGVKMAGCTATTCTYPLGLVVTQSTSNAVAITATGNGTANGITATGGSSNGNGVTATGGAGGGNARGVQGTGINSGAGIYGQGGGSSGAGGEFVGGATNGAGAAGTGNGTGAGGIFVGGGSGGPGIVVTGTSTRGDIEISNSDPASTTGFSDSVTTMNVVKAWARVATSAPSVTAGFNITSVADSGLNNITVTFQTDFANTSYGCVVSDTTANSNLIYGIAAIAVGSIVVTAVDSAGTTIDLSDTVNAFTIMCLGSN